MQQRADSAGKVWITAQIGDVVATFAIGGDGGVPFVPGQLVELDDVRLADVCNTLLPSFGAAAVEITTNES